MIFSFLCIHCRKNDGNNPLGTGTQARCLISTKTVFSPAAPGDIEHDSIEYNIIGQFSGYHLGAIKQGVISYGNHYEIKYTAQGKIDSIIYFQANLVGGIYRVIYNNNFVAAAISAFGRPDTINFSWNAHGQNELDAATYQVNSGCIQSSQTSFFNYQASSALTSDVQSETGTSCAVKGRVEEVYTVFSTNPQSIQTKSPFRDSTTHEQQFLYYYFHVLDAGIVLSKNWPLPVFEGYSYAAGQQTPGSHFYYSYATDNNHRVTSVARHSAVDYPGFNQYYLFDSTKISYRCR